MCLLLFFSLENSQDQKDTQVQQQQQSTNDNAVATTSSGLGYEPESPISPLDPNETIDFSRVYALHTFVANLDGQVCVLKGDSLELLDDSNSYWWLVKCIKTDEVRKEK